MHISLVAVNKGYQIPLSCFNKRYCYFHSDVMAPEPMSDNDDDDDDDEMEDDASSSPPSPQQSPSLPYQSLHPGKVVFEVVQKSQIHITQSSVDLKYGDDKSCKIRGGLLSQLIFLLNEVVPKLEMEQTDELLEFTGSFVQFLQAYYNREDGTDGGPNGHEPQVVVPHATTPTSNNSYKTVPVRVGQECAEALKRIGYNFEGVTSPTKKKKQ